MIKELIIMILLKDDTGATASGSSFYLPLVAFLLGKGNIENSLFRVYGGQASRNLLRKDC